MSENKDKINMLNKLAEKSREQGNPFAINDLTTSTSSLPIDSAIVANMERKANKLANLEKKSVDQVIDLAEMELKRSGITLYGHNGPINLTPMQHKFVMGYVKTGSVKDAMKFTGYKGKPGSAANIGYQLFNDPLVAEAISVFERQHILASGLSELEVIAGIRDVTMLARQKNQFGAALKGFAMLGDFLQMWDQPSKAKGKTKDSQALTINGDIFINNSGDQKDMMNDVKNLAKGLGIEINTGIRPDVIRDITADALISKENLDDNEELPKDKA